MDPNGEAREQPTEKTYILKDASNAPNSDAKDPTLLTSQLPEFSVPEGSDGPQEPRLVEGAFPGVPPQEDPKAEKSSLPLTAFNFINSIVGSGVIGMPYALSQSGFGTGLLLIVVMGLVTDYTLVLLIEAGTVAGVTTYQELVREAFGTTGYHIQTILQFLYPFISLVSYNILVGDTLTKVIIRITGISTMSVVVKREFIITTVTLLITLPLSLYRNMARLAKVSMVAVFIIIVISASMIYRSFSMADEVEATPGAWTFAKSNIASSIGVISFAFMCHHISFLVFESLQDNTQPRWKTTTHISISAAVMVSIIFAVAGYATFTGYIQGDVFENYCWGDDLMNVCRGLYALTILLTYPIECFVCREVVEKSLFGAYQPQPFFRHAALTVLIAIVSFLISLTTDCLGNVLEFNGVICAIPMAYIIGPLCYIRVTEGPLFCRAKIGAWAVIAGGIAVVVCWSSSFVISDESYPDCSHGQQMAYCFKNGTSAGA